MGFRGLGLRYDMWNEGVFVAVRTTGLEASGYAQLFEDLSDPSSSSGFWFSSRDGFWFYGRNANADGFNYFQYDADGVPDVDTPVGMFMLDGGGSSGVDAHLQLTFVSGSAATGENGDISFTNDSDPTPANSGDWIGNHGKDWLVECGRDSIFTAHRDYMVECHGDILLSAYGDEFSREGLINIGGNRTYVHALGTGTDVLQLEGFATQATVGAAGAAAAVPATPDAYLIVDGYAVPAFALS